MKECSRCKDVKLIELFGTDKSKPDGKRIYCKECEKLNRKIQYDRHKDIILRKKKDYYIDNIESIKQSRKEYYLSNRDSIKENARNYISNNKEKVKESKRVYNKNNREQINKYLRTRYQNDDLYRFSVKVKSMIKKIFKQRSFNKTLNTKDIIGCSIYEFISYLESKFEYWMTWDNYGIYNGDFNFGWDLDHIIPISSGKTEDEIRKLNHFTNLQPLCSKVNRDIKRNKF